MKKHTFSKEERLRNKRLIDGLFRDGSSFLIHPYRVLYMHVAGLHPKVQVLLSVSKRRFRHAVDRNLLKRRMREAYRLQKGALLYPAIAAKDEGVVIAIQYVGRELADYTFMHQRMGEVLHRLSRTMS